jgi:hypothetical protein
MHSAQHLLFARTIVVAEERLILNIVLWLLLMRLNLKVKEYRACRLVFAKRTNAFFISFNISSIKPEQAILN